MSAFRPWHSLVQWQRQRAEAQARVALESRTGSALVATLHAFDRYLLAALRQGLIRLISVSFLLQQPAGWRLPKLQVLERLPGALLPPVEAAAMLHRSDRSVFAHSYGWVARGHPDVTGERMSTLCNFFRRLQRRGQLPWNAALFWE